MLLATRVFRTPLVASGRAHAFQAIPGGEIHCVSTETADASPGETPRMNRNSAAAQFGGAVAPLSAHLSPANLHSHHVPGGKSASRPARWSARAARYWSRNALFHCRASMRAHLFRQATRGESPRRGSRVFGLSFQR